MKPYTYLLFDVDQTLLDFHRSEHEAIIQTLTEYACPVSEHIVSLYSRVNDEHWKMLERGEIDRATLRWRRFAALGERAGFVIADPEAFACSYEENLSQKSYLLDGALEVCRRLSGHYEMCTVTNGHARVQHGRFDPSPLAPLFSHCFISGEMGCNKPSQAFFDIVCQTLPELEPGKTLVIGDSLTSDIAGGVAWGCDTCWLCPAAEQRLRAEQMGLRPTYIVERLEQILDILL